VKALVLCAGFGTRLGALCDDRPKPLLEVGGIPIVEHIVRHLAKAGFRDIIINLHYRAEQFPASLGDGERFGVTIDYRFEETPLGTAGTSRQLLAELGEDLLVHYGDILTDHDLQGLCRQHRRTGAAATALLHQRPGSNSFALLDERDRITRFVERPDAPPAVDARAVWAFSGICVLSPACHVALGALPGGMVLDLPRDLFPTLARQRSLFGQRLEGYRCAIDSEARLEAARAAFAAGRFRPEALLAEAHASPAMAPAPAGTPRGPLNP
jgi:NDP-sugar pyrophosphorylase family protein